MLSFKAKSSFNLSLQRYPHTIDVKAFNSFNTEDRQTVASLRLVSPGRQLVVSPIFLKKLTIFLVIVLCNLMAFYLPSPNHSETSGVTRGRGWTAPGDTLQVGDTRRKNIFFVGKFTKNSGETRSVR